MRNDLLGLLLVGGLLQGCGPDLKDAQKLGFGSVAEMQEMQAAGYQNKAAYDAEMAKARALDLAKARELGFDTVDEMKTLQAQGYQTKTEWTERYKKYGFESLDQMNALKARGYATMADYKEVKAMTPARFYVECKLASKDDYSAKCMTKRVSWRGVIRRLNTSDGVNVDVKNDDGSNLESAFDIDSKALLTHVKKEDIGKYIEFDGVIDRQNFATPDIEGIVFAQVETDAEREARLAKIKRQDEKALNANATNAEWLDDKFGVKAAVECSSDADDYLRQVAKYSFQWDETGWLSTKFGQYRTQVPAPGVMRYVSNKLSMQNGFGAFQRMTITCDYDTRKGKVVGYALE
jgi:hypothetical protein